MTRFAIVQFRSTRLEPDANLERAVGLLGEAAASGAELAIFPECALTGYFLSAEEAETIAEPIPGPRTERLVEAARRAGCLAVAGTIERGPDGCCYNAAVLVGQQGVLGRYRKTHRIHLGVDRFLTAGDDLPGPFDTRIGRLGILICYDLRFPEPARALALRGAQALLLPTAWPAAATLYPDYVARTRASENGIYVFAADHVGEELGARYLGRSLAVGPDGEVIAEAGKDEETILLVDADLTRSQMKRRVFIPGEYEIDLIADRRPDLYGPISEQA